MQKIEKALRERVKELLQNGTATKVIGWEKGEFFYDNTPAVIKCAEDSDKLVYNGFCAANLSKYLVANNTVQGKTIVLLKPCDTYSMNQLFTENRINKENVYIIGVGCDGMVDIEKLRAQGIKGIKSIQEKDGTLYIDTVYGSQTAELKTVLLEKCMVCKGKKHVVYDELFASDEADVSVKTDRFDMVEKLENMTAAERFEFWKTELSKCIRCNACRNACPACTCRKCVFDNSASGIASKANSNEFEEKMFHIIRAYHVAGRCTDCGECSRVCPQNIPLHLLNRKFIKDINGFYGDYQAGEQVSQRNPLVNFTKSDIEPTKVSDKKGE